LNQTQTKKNRAKLAKSLAKPKKPSQNRFEPVFVPKKPSQNKKTEPNWFEPVFVLKNRIETGQFELVLVFFKKKFQFNFFF